MAGISGGIPGVPPPSGPPPLLNVDELQHLCGQGWLYYDVPQHLQDQLKELSTAASSFFEKSSEEKVGHYPPSRGTEYGYYQVTGEKEYITLRRQSQNGDPEIEKNASNVWTAVGRLFHRILCDLSRAGDINSAVWDGLVAESLTYPPVETDLDNVTSLMRLFRYFPESGTADQHTDLGLLTLCIGGGPGLQVLDRSGEDQWLDATRPTILVGATLSALSQGLIRPGSHKVVGNPNGRYSIVFALRPHLQGHTDLTLFGGEGVVENRKLYADVKGKKYNVNARPEIREQQRQAQRDKLKAQNGMG